MKILSSLLFIFISFAKPIVGSLEVEADNPLNICERMKDSEDKKNSDKQACEVLANRENLDWYAATMCGVIKDDKKVIECWTQIEGSKMSPPQLKECEKKSKNDDQLFACIVALGKRSPASIAPAYQNK